MKIYTIVFFNEDMRRNDNITVSTLKDIDIPLGGSFIESLKGDVLKFVEAAFEVYLRENLKEDWICYRFSDLIFVNVFEMEYPLI